MRRIAVINQKGGVGKTTTTANLGGALTRSGRRVLLIDLDPQAHLTLHYGMEVADDQPSVYDVLTASLPVQDVAFDVCEGATLVPADIDLAGAEAELISIMGREVVLREALDAFGADHDVMLVDCPPSLGILTINALAAVDEIIIPLQAQFFALQGLSKLLETVTLVRQRINPSLTVSGIALCMHESTTKLAGEIVEDVSRFLAASRDSNSPWSSARIYESRIRRNIKLAEASSFGQTIFDYAPRSNGATDYRALAEEIFGDSATGSTPPRSIVANTAEQSSPGTDRNLPDSVPLPPADTGPAKSEESAVTLPASPDVPPVDTLVGTP